MTRLKPIMHCAQLESFLEHEVLNSLPVELYSPHDL